MNTRAMLSAHAASALAACAAPSATHTITRHDVAEQTHEEERTMSDQEHINATIQQIFGGVDARRFDDVRAAMAPTLHVDYSDLGGHSGEIAAADLVGGWADFLPRFDRTIHQVHNVSIAVVGDRAQATFDAIAAHAIVRDGDVAVWTVFAGYDAEFESIDGAWRLSRLNLSLYEQSGDTSLPAVAAARAAEPLAAEAPAGASAAADAFFAALEANDLGAMQEVLGEGVVQEMPLAPKGFPSKIDGQTALLGLFGNIIELPQRYVQRTVHPLPGANAVLVSFAGQVEVADGRTYQNSYVNLFEVDESGRITRIVEHFNPDTLLANWPGLEPEHHSVHASGAPRGEVTAEPVTFERGGVTLRGTLFRPEGAKEGEKLDAVIVAGSWTSVRQQMPDVYASRLAATGMAALTFDFTGYGESGGEVRQLEDPELKIADIEAAYAYMSGREDIGAVSGMGICAGAGYMAHAVARQPGFAKLVLVAPWLHDEEMARGIYDMRPGGSDGLIAAGREAAAKTARGEGVEYVLATSELDPLSAMYVPGGVFGYYLDPAKGAGAHYDNRFAVASWEPWITFDAISAAARLTDRPVHIVHSESGAVPDGARRFFEDLQGPKTIAWLNEYSQEQIYHEPEAVGAVMGELEQVFSAK